jgi:hypothetical protein
MKLSGLPFLLILILCAMFPSGATESATTLAAESTKNAAGDDSTPDDNTRADKSKSSSIIPSTAQPAETYTYQIENYYYNSVNGWNWLGIVAALSTLGLVIFAAWQMWFVKQSARATEIAAEAAKKSAEATANNVFAARELANLERPWIIVGNKSLVGFPLEETSIISPIQIEISWELTNVGRTPGLITSVSKAIVCAPPIDIPEPFYADDPLPASELLIPPSGDHAETSRKDISLEEFADFMTRKTCVMFYGRIQYYDTSRRDLHVTRFCYRWYIENDRLMQDSVGPRNYVEYS